MKHKLNVTLHAPAKLHFNSLFVRMVAMFLLILMPLFLSGVLIHEWGLHIIRDELDETVRTQTRHNAQILESELERIQVLQDDLLVDEDLLFLSSVPDAFGSFEKVKAVNRLRSRVRMFTSSSLYIEDVEIMIDGIDRVISAEKGVGELSPDDRELMNSFPQYIASLLRRNDSQLFTIVKGSITDAKVMPSFVIRLVLSIPQLEKTISVLNLYPGSAAFLYCPSNGFLSTSVLDDGIHKDASTLEETTTFALWTAIESNLHTAIADEVNALDSILTVNHVRYHISAQRFMFRESFWMVSAAPEQQILQSLQPYILLLWGFVAVSLVLIVIFALSIRRFVHKPMSVLVDAFRTVETGNFETSIDHNAKDEFGYLYRQFNNMLQYIHNLIHQVYNQKIMSQKAELKQLQSQINPHFLYNSFFILQRMIQGSDIDNAREFSGFLGRYFQYVTRNGQDVVPLELEVQHSRNYLDIQSVRFSGTEITVGDIPEKIQKFPIPRLILQPVVENVFNHAFGKGIGLRLIVIRFLDDDLFVRIVVENSATGVDSAAIEKLRNRLQPATAEEVETTGLANIHRRIRLMYGEESGLTLSESELGGWCVTISMKKEQEHKDAETTHY